MLYFSWVKLHLQSSRAFAGTRAYSDLWAITCAHSAHGNSLLTVARRRALSVRCMEEVHVVCVCVLIRLFMREIVYVSTHTDCVCAVSCLVVGTVCPPPFERWSVLAVLKLGVLLEHSCASDWCTMHGQPCGGAFRMRIAMTRRMLLGARDKQTLYY